jgi:hypothetical protein
MLLNVLEIRRRDILIEFLGYKLHGWDSNPTGARFYSSPQHPDLHWGLSNLLFIGYGGNFPRVKQPEYEANNSPPSSADVKNSEGVPPLPPYVFMAQCLINYTHGQPYLPTLMPYPIC